MGTKVASLADCMPSVAKKSRCRVCSLPDDLRAEVASYKAAGRTHRDIAEGLRRLASKRGEPLIDVGIHSVNDHFRFNHDQEKED